MEGVYKPVNVNQKRFLCDTCDRWYHTKCEGINDPLYSRLSKSSNLWSCANCALPKFDSLFIESIQPTSAVASPTSLVFSHSSFNITNLNVHSFMGHLEQVTEFVSTHSPDILAMSETWLDSSVEDLLLEIPGFNIHRKYRHCHGGGVAIYTNVTLKCK